MTAGSLDSSLPRLASLLCFIPRSQTPAEGEKRFYLPAAAASHSLLLDLPLSLSLSLFLTTPPLPPRLSSSYPLPCYSCPPSLSLAPSLELCFLAVSEQLSMPQTHIHAHKNTHREQTLDPKAFLNGRDGGGKASKREIKPKSDCCISAISPRNEKTLSPSISISICLSAHRL